MRFADYIVCKLHIYLLVVLFVACLLGMAVVRLSRGGPADEQSMTAAERLKVIEKLAPKSPQMSQFLQNERGAQESNREACGGSR